MKKAKVLVMKAKMKNQGLKMFWVIFPEQCRKSVLLICCIVWPLPKIIFSGLPASRQLLRNKRTIPVTNVAELVEYVLLPHNNEVTKPPALKTFLVGLAELGIDKGLITENDSQETEISSPVKFTVFHSNSPCEHCQNFNVYWILVMKCPKCFWHDYYKIVLYAITRFMRGERGLSSVSWL